MSQAGYEPTIPESDLPQTHALDRAATGLGSDADSWYSVIFEGDLVRNISD